jgi:iron-sulfur cluster insertion protein
MSPFEPGSTHRGRSCGFARLPIGIGDAKALYSTETAMIAITPLAAEKVREISEAEGLTDQGLRLRVVGGGCAGFQYDLYFEESPTEFDERFESNGVQLYIDPLSYQYLDGTEIDYVEGAHGSGFKFGNPNVSGTCGCGSSFQV